MIQRLIHLALMIAIPGIICAQQEAMLYGTLNDSTSRPIPYANIVAREIQKGTVSDSAGYYSLSLPAGRQLHIIISSVGYESQEIPVILQTGEQRQMDRILLRRFSKIGTVNVSGQAEHKTTFQRIDIREIERLPAITGQIESMLKTLPGVSSNNELSSQYSVRGGNFDENLVVVNDVEIYRPFLVRSGQQEGLSFINPDLVSSLRFSAGGFEASYGDKMSSVLDVTYREPSKTAASASASFLGGTAHLEGILGKGRLKYLAGIRYKTTQYLLNSLDVKGDYKPAFLDLQTYLTYQASEKVNFSFLGNLSENKYRFMPTNRSTAFGTVQDAVQLYIWYDGREADRFSTLLGAVTATWKPSGALTLKLINTGFRTQEGESFDIEGSYSLNELEKELGSENLGDSVMNIGIGRFLNHARNYLTACVFATEHRGSYHTAMGEISWGLRVQHETISNQINEWELTDSAGYSIPYNGQEVNLSYAYHADIDLSSNRMSSFLQYRKNTRLGRSGLTMNAGLRMSYWDLNDEWLLSPRINAWLDPAWSQNLQFYASAGYYYQPPFFKELRDPAGNLNRNIQSQKSIQLVLGSDYIFTAWGRPFKYTTELYYKKLDRLIPYTVDNVRIKYAGKNLATGYATGLDMKVNGEFVEGVESWISLSLMQTREDIRNDVFYDEDNHETRPGYYPRPTDQLINFAMYFQDYLPIDPSYRVQLSLHYGSGLPSTAPYTNRYDQVFRMPAYRRVDIGFTKVFREEGKDAPHPWLKPFRSLWISAEIFNLLDINNTISYQWITTVNNLSGETYRYAVPNFLTSRRLNIRITAKF